MKLARFESAKGPKYNKEDFQREQDELHASLLVAQRACRAAGVPIVILISGVEAAGKSGVVNRLSKWLDMRNVRTVSYWRESDDERMRPRDWRFWRDLPGKGEISILFGSWYTHPIVKAATGLKKPKKIHAYLQQEYDHINQFEKLLADDGVVFVKLWFHISKAEQQARIKAKKKAGHLITPYEKSLSKSYDEFASVSHEVINNTDTEIGHWHIIDSSDKRSRDLRAGRILLEHMDLALEEEHVATTVPEFKLAKPQLSQINLNKSLTEKQYKKQLDKYQARLAKLHWEAWEQQRSTVLMFEGWDAGGKGGAIRRLTGAMDARLYRVIPVAAPTDEEKAHHYLWRFWLHISAEEQLHRFSEREKIEHKKHKLTEEDWRNRERWSAYEQAVDDLLLRTDRLGAPWYVIPANDKLYARIQVIKSVCEQMEKSLK